MESTGSYLEIYSAEGKLDLSNIKGPRDRARRIFFYYAANSFVMDDHLDALKEFRRYGPTEDEENEWRREFISYWVSQLSVDDLTPVNRLELAQAHEAIDALAAMSGRGDDYARLWYANAIWHLAWILKLTPQVARPKNAEQKIRLAAATSVEIWSSLVRDEIHLTDAHRAQLDQLLRRHRYDPYPVRGGNPEGYVIDYAWTKLAEAEKRPLFDPTSE